MITLGGIEASKLYVGGDEATKVYYGTQRVFPPFDKTLGYASDGLVAMWDGICNTGTERHDSTATKWVEMFSGAESAAITNQVWDEDGLRISNTALTLLTDCTSILTGKPYTVEMVAQEITKSADANAAGGVRVKSVDAVGFFRHANGNCWGPANFRVKNLYCSMKIDGLTYSQVYPKANKSIVVLNYNPTSTSNIRNAAKVYYNGVLRSTHLYSFQYGTAPTATTDIIILSSTAGVHKYLNIRIYDRELTQAEIAANYAIDIERFNIT